MLLNLVLEPERIAYKFQGWRGPVHMAVGFGVGLFGYFVVNLFMFVSSFGRTQAPLGATTIWIVLAIEAVALVTMLYGAWLFYKDTMYQAWRIDAELHRHTRW
ncbi:hypothetical protein [Comamonas jiangduensis]|uniref:hypothetical protein n=1 Tax=Comamonas jiangduensis TaxID=1194168 RepID=UPI001583C47B|nr:hypothetical protein [Comamonas jiangduensis]